MTASAYPLIHRALVCSRMDMFQELENVNVLSTHGPILPKVKVDLHEDAVAGDMTRMNKVYREQLAERARRNPKEVAAEARARGRVLKIVRLVFGALAVTGFGAYTISHL